MLESNRVLLHVTREAVLRFLFLGLSLDAVDGHALRQLEDDSIVVVLKFLVDFQEVGDRILLAFDQNGQDY